jgi:hypothetical protein
MKIKVKVDYEDQSLMGPSCSLVDEDGNRIENTSFVHWHGEKRIDNRKHVYLIIAIPEDELYFEEKGTSDEI